MRHKNIPIPPRHANSDIFPYLPTIGIEYDPWIVDQDKLSTFTSLDVMVPCLKPDTVGEP